MTETVANTVRTLVELMLAVVAGMGEEFGNELQYRIDEEVAANGRVSSAEHGTPGGATRHDRDKRTRKERGLGKDTDHPVLWGSMCKPCKDSRNDYNKARKDKQEAAADLIFSRAMELRGENTVRAGLDGMPFYMPTEAIQGVPTLIKGQAHRIGWALNGDPVVVPLKAVGKDRILDTVQGDDPGDVQALIDLNMIGWNGSVRRTDEVASAFGTLEAWQITAYPGPWQIAQAKRS